MLSGGCLCCCWGGNGLKHTQLHPTKPPPCPLHHHNSLSVWCRPHDSQRGLWNKVIRKCSCPAQSCLVTHSLCLNLASFLPQGLCICCALHPESSPLYLTGLPSTHPQVSAQLSPTRVVGIHCKALSPAPNCCKQELILEFLQRAQREELPLTSHTAESLDLELPVLSRDGPTFPPLYSWMLGPFLQGSMRGVDDVGGMYIGPFPK